MFGKREHNHSHHVVLGQDKESKKSGHAFTSFELGTFCRLPDLFKQLLRKGLHSKTLSMPASKFQNAGTRGRRCISDDFISYDKGVEKQIILAVDMERSVTQCCTVKSKVLVQVMRRPTLTREIHRATTSIPSQTHLCCLELPF